MRYDELYQEALRGVMVKALERVAREGLPGDHHFYIAFRTDAPGVKISEALRRRYPKEMTIVLQHQFWGLKVGPESFEVNLSFGNVPEHLTIPYKAIKGFLDPSVTFVLQFQVDGDTSSAFFSEPESEDGDAETPRAQSDASPSRQTGPASAPSDSPPTPPPDAPQDDGLTGDVVSLDAFRKK